MTTATESKYFVQAFVRFLQNQIETCNFSSDIVESLEVAAQCLETAYDLPSLNEASNGSNSTENPLNYIDLYEIYKSTCCVISPERKQEAENIKNEANLLMQEEKYNEALNSYNRAISIDATNPVFYCNRAAAFSRMGNYQKAADDCKMALRYDSNYSKAYGRLGMAYSKMNKHQEAEEAYKNAIRLDPENADYQNNLCVTQQRIKEASSAQPNSVEGLSTNIADQMGGINFSAAFNNPTLMNLATQMMADPNMQGTISQLRNQLDNMSNINGIFELGRELVGQMRERHPAAFEAVATAAATTAAANSDLNPQNPSNNGADSAPSAPDN